MNYLLHTYAKPLICWGHGVVMGGGSVFLRVPISRGQRAHAYRYAEITIALFPDVGGSWFLNRMPGQVGRFLALTSSTSTRPMRSFVGWARILANEQRPISAELTKQAWSGDAAANHELSALCSLARGRR